MKQENYCEIKFLLKFKVKVIKGYSPCPHYTGLTMRLQSVFSCHMLHYMGIFRHFELQNGRYLKAQRCHDLVISKQKFSRNQDGSCFQDGGHILKLYT